MSIGNKILEGMQNRSSVALQDYELLANLYSVDRQAFEFEKKQRVDFFINNAGTDERRELLRQTQLEWDLILKKVV